VFNQLKAVLFTVALSGVVSFIILKVIDATVGLRVTQEQEVLGLDLSEHDEKAYND
jgi:Amt family ammonium transporter